MICYLPTYLPNSYVLACRQIFSAGFSRRALSPVTISGESFTSRLSLCNVPRLHDSDPWIGSPIREVPGPNSPWESLDYAVHCGDLVGRHH